MRTIRYRFPLGPAQTLLLVLPGISDLPGDFFKNGLAEAAWRAGIRADVMEADTHLGYYLRATVVERLHDDLIRVARSQGYEQVWLVGISLGGLGALLYARDHAETIDGMVLLAPFVGQDCSIASSRWVRGPRQRQGDPVGDLAHTLWSWLVGPARKPPIYIGFGDQDRFAPRLRLLAEWMPHGSVFVTAGGHDWTTWSSLWETILPRLLTQSRHFNR